MRKRKIVQIIVAAVVILGMILSSIVVALANQPIRVTINGRTLVMDAHPVVQNDRTLVPLRAIFEVLGAIVEWNASTRTITGRKGEKVVSLQIDNPKARIGNAVVTLAVPPTVINERTMVPTRFVAESLGANVVWDNQTRTVVITTDESSASTVRTMSARVVRVTDGDTIRVSFESGREESVRLIGVDTPESTREIEPFGKEAAAFTKSQLEGKTVLLEMDVTERDRFGRLLAYVWLSQPSNDKEPEVKAKMFNAKLMLQGFAQVMTIAPNVKYADMFITFEREARDASRGLWAQTAPRNENASVIVVSSVNLTAETVVIENRGAETVNISGWTLVSERGDQRFVFPTGTTITANSRITVVSGPNATSGAGRLVWTRSNIWNNDGDPAVLLDAEGMEVSRRE